MPELPTTVLPAGMGSAEPPRRTQVQDITLEITELLQWLEQVELQLFFSKPAWGHPDTTKEKLTAHLVSTGALPASPCFRAVPECPLGVCVYPKSSPLCTKMLGPFSAFLST